MVQVIRYHLVYSQEHDVQISIGRVTDAVHTCMPSQALALLPLTAVAYALLSARGKVIAVNAGFCRLSRPGMGAAVNPADEVGSDALAFFCWPQLSRNHRWQCCGRRPLVQPSQGARFRVVFQLPRVAPKVGEDPKPGA